MNKIALTVILASLALGASPFIADQTLVEKNQVLSMNMSAKVVQTNNTSAKSIKAGVNPGKNMDFGEISKDVNVTKFLDVETGGQRIAVTIETEGNITEKLDYKESQLVEGDKQVNVKFIPNELGYYDGHITVKTIVAKDSLGEKWLDIRSLFF